MQQEIDNVYLCSDVREFEQWLYGEGEVTPENLMQRAGQAGLRYLIENWPDAKSIAVFCGRGNNAGDGFELARLAVQQGMEVTMILLEPSDAMTHLAVKRFELAEQVGITIHHAEENADNWEWPNVDVCVDAILGIGQTRALDERYASWVQKINAHSSPCIALDVPTGVNADTGRSWGEPVQADLTVTFLLPKAGLFTSQGLAQSGHVIFDDLDVSAKELNITAHARCLHWSGVQKKLPLRDANAHKGDFGRVLVIGGDYGMGGAVRLAAEAAMRIGAGRVTVATRPEHVAVVSGSRPELMCVQALTGEDLKPLIEQVDVIVIGPGLGQSDWSKELFEVAIQSDLPLIVDADGLNLLAKSSPDSKFIPCEHWCLTPHPGEAARLIGGACDSIQQDRFVSVQNIQKKYGGVVVLKGAGSLVADASKQPIKICTAGNPGMASGGMGDILSGVLGGLVAQGLSLTDAATTGVLLHARAADIAALEDGERGLMATDVLYYMRQLANPQRRS